MKAKKSLARTNVIMVSVTLLAVLLLSGNGKAEAAFKSQGKIVFDNGTRDTTDDVVFDSSDFNRLAYTCR